MCPNNIEFRCDAAVTTQPRLLARDPDTRFKLRIWKEGERETNKSKCIIPERSGIVEVPRFDKGRVLLTPAVVMLDLGSERGGVVSRRVSDFWQLCWTSAELAWPAVEPVKF